MANWPLKEANENERDIRAEGANKKCGRETSILEMIFPFLLLLEFFLHVSLDFFLSKMERKWLVKF